MHLIDKVLSNGTKASISPLGGGGKHRESRSKIEEELRTSVGSGMKIVSI